jgi:superfamily I DNA/RNA helicase
MTNGVEAELAAAVEAVLRSESRRKLVVAGPGAGKTTLFRRLLEANPGDRQGRLVLTFINNLKDDLERSLGDLAQVSTLHGFCQSLLRRHGELRDGLTRGFRCLPGLVKLIQKDWAYLQGTEPPAFFRQMRHLEDAPVELDFYLSRGAYYDAVDFDDSVYRTFLGLQNNAALLERYEMVLIDEYQDFNALEATIIEFLAQASPIIVAGDDDQALYSDLRGASWDHIRSLYRGGDYEIFHLPFCMRCPEVIVGAVNDILDRARANNRLDGRIAKPYRHYAPVKGEDSRRYPTINNVNTTVQRLNANYFGRYIEQQIRTIPAEDIDSANEKHEPVALVIGSKQYLRQIEAHLVGTGFTVESGKERADQLTREIGLQILAESPESNLGWRVILEFKPEADATRYIEDAYHRELQLFEVLPDALRQRTLDDAHALRVADTEEEQPVPEPNQGQALRIKLTSYEGAKGLSAQHVFVAGLHAGDLPRDPEHIRDIEICRFVVALTRTKKKCHLLHTRRFATDIRDPSPFIGWINQARLNPVRVDAAYWN